MNKEQQSDDASAEERHILPPESEPTSEERCASPGETAPPDIRDAIVYVEFPGFGGKRMLLIW